jgi:Flp pilus assembly protein TadG
MTGARVFGRRRPGKRGQALVEFALTIPIVLLMFMILVDFGRVIFAQNAINQDAREAARAGAVPARTGCSPTTVDYSQCQYDWVRAAAKVAQPGVTLADANITGRTGANCVTAAAGATPTQTGVNDSTVTYAGSTYCFYPFGTGTGKQVEVRIQVTVPFITPIIGAVVGGSITIEAKAQSFIQCGTGTPKCQ